MIDLKPACDRMTELLAAVSTDRLTAATPCAEYTVAELIGHLDGGAEVFAAMARKEGPIDPDAGAPATDLGADWRGRVSEHVRALGDAWADPEAWQDSSNLGELAMPNQVWGRIALTEIVVHGWDLATVTGQPFELPEPTLRACFEHVEGFLPEAPIPSLWGPPVPVPADAPLLDRIVGLTGRTP